MRSVISGGLGFVGSHLQDELLAQGHEVWVIDNLITGDRANLNPKSMFLYGDIGSALALLPNEVDWFFHCAAIARTQWCVDDPLLANATNVTGTLKALEWARERKVKRFVHSSSCIVYVKTTPYWVSKEAAENYVSIYPDLYGLSTIALRYSNIYGSLRQSEKGPAINCLASLRKSKREQGYIWITGTGEQTRDFIHVDDVVRANIMAAQSPVTGWYDVCTGKQTSMNEMAAYFACPIEYIEERAGDVKEIISDPVPAERDLGFKYSIEVPDGIGVYL